MLSDPILSRAENRLSWISWIVFTNADQDGTLYIVCVIPTILSRAGADAEDSKIMWVCRTNFSLGM